MLPLETLTQTLIRDTDRHSLQTLTQTLICQMLTLETLTQTLRDANSALFGASRFFHVCLGDLCESCRSVEFFFKGV